MNSKIILWVLAVVVLATSCTKRIELELNNGDYKRLVVEGWITDQVKAHEVRLSWTSSYYHNEPAPNVSGATVMISDGSSVFSLSEQPVGSGRYFTDPTVAGSVGNTYTLNIEHNGETWMASDQLLPVAVVDSVALEYVDQDLGPDQEPYYDVLIWTVETPGIGNYYRWHTLLNGVNLRDTLANSSFSDDALVDGSEIIGVEIDFIEASRVQSGDTVTLEQHSISELAYDVIIAVLTETDWRGGLFDAPPANVPSNISNGGLGFFGAASVSAKSVVVP